MPELVSMAAAVSWATSTTSSMQSNPAAPGATTVASAQKKAAIGGLGICLLPISSLQQSIHTGAAAGAIATATVQSLHAINPKHCYQYDSC